MFLRYFCVLFFLGVTVTLFGQTHYTDSSFHLVNSPLDEQNPVLSPNGKMLFFTVRGHEQNIDGKRDPGDIWYSNWSENQWTAPIHAGKIINDRGYNAVAGFSLDGSMMYLLSHYDASGLARTQGISISRRIGTEWSKPENISIPYFQNKSAIQTGRITHKGSVFIYSADTYGSYGVDDIYVSQKGNDGKWSEPRNLGPVINTQFQELCPSLSEDGTILYFSSNGRNGMGSFDMYSSTRLDDTYTNWSSPINLGQPINSEGRELFMTSFDHLGLKLYTSTKNSDGYGDIKFQQGEKSVDSVFVSQSEIVEPIQSQIEEPQLPDDKIKLYGRVTNAKTGEVIQAKISFINSDTTIIIETLPTGFATIVNKQTKFNVDLESTGFVSELEQVDLEGLNRSEIELNFTLQPIEVGATVNLKSVLFIQSKSELLPESYPELDLVVAFMKANPHLSIELAGHTDNRGSFRSLMQLSQQRVNRVKEYLVSKGIDKKRITGRGYGGTKPIAGNDTEEQRMLNRRVEFIIKKL